jgi:hypothetical protein
LDRLAEWSAGSVALLRLCAFLVPQDIPRAVLAGHADALPAELAAVAADPLDLADAVGALRRYGLVTATEAETIHGAPAAPGWSSAPPSATPRPSGGKPR